MHVENGGKWVVSFEDAEMMQLRGFVAQYSVITSAFVLTVVDLEQIRSISFWKKMSPRISFIKV